MIASNNTTTNKEETTMSNRFVFTSNDGYHDAELTWELPKLNGKERSLCVRLTLVEGMDRAYPVITYEVDGNLTELVDNPGFTEALWLEITGNKQNN
jgi:hypothetical protein